MKRIRLGNYCKITAGGDKPKVFSIIKNDECFVPVYSNGIENNGLVGYTNKATISEESVTVAARGSCGYAFFRDTPYVPIIRLISIIPFDDNVLDTKYLYYLLKLLPYQGIGSVQSQITVPQISDYSIDFIDDNIKQKKIAKTLSLLDYKIENNNKINAELESMAKTLYDYWFLQFEFPNENGKPYKSSGGKMVWNEELKREIPEGWKVSKIGDILEEANKSKIQVNDAKEKGKYPFFTSGEKILCYDDYLVKGFNIFLNTGGNPDIKAYMGKCAYSTDTWCVSAKEYSYILFYYLLKLMPQFEQLFFAGSGLKHLQKDSLKNQYILLPDEKVLRNFNNICELIWKKITNCLIENQELTALRDFLLPLLMNGQVTFKE